MKALSLFAFFTSLALAACASAPDVNEPDSNDPSVSQTEEGLSARQICKRKKAEKSCLAAAGGRCIWADFGQGHECRYEGLIVPFGPGASAPACVSNTSESSCLGEDGCAWGDRGNGLECFYLGRVVPQAN